MSNDTMSNHEANEGDKRKKAEPTEVGFIDLLIEIRKLKGEIFSLKERVARLEAESGPIA